MNDFFGTGTRVAIAVTGAISVIAAVAGGAITFFVTNASLASQVAANTARINTMQTTLDAVAQSASGLTARVATLEGKVTNGDSRSSINTERIAALRADVVRLMADLREVETQFCASDTIRNLMHANDLRIYSLLWQKVYKFPYPTDNAYYPMVCNRNTQSSLVSSEMNGEK
jgi:hypothetical protein